MNHLAPAYVLGADEGDLAHRALGRASKRGQILTADILEELREVAARGNDRHCRWKVFDIAGLDDPAKRSLDMLARHLQRVDQVVARQAEQEHDMPELAMPGRTETKA